MAGSERLREQQARELARPTVGVCWEHSTLEELGQLAVSYQNAQFHHLKRFANVVSWGRDPAVHRAALKSAGKPGALIVFDERALVRNPALLRSSWPEETAVVYVTHDWWLRPCAQIDWLRRQPSPLVVLRHLSGLALFERLAPEIPKVVQRPGVETSLFHPRGPKEWDVLLGGSETEDYPLRIRLNRIVRENAARFRWRVLDLTATGLVSNPRSNQLEYAPALAAAKVSPTATSHGGRRGATIALQYLDHSPTRAQVDDPLDSFALPDVLVEEWETAAITPRYLESLASGTLLLADLPACDAQEWYGDKMVVVDEASTDEEIAETIDWWVRHDDEREALCAHALRETLATEASEIRAAELAVIVADHLGL